MKKAEEDKPAKERAKPQPTRAEIKVMDKCDKLLLSLPTEEERQRVVLWLANTNGMHPFVPLRMPPRTTNQNDGPTTEPSVNY